MDLAALVQYTHQKLGEQTAFYPLEEVVRAGINPAQRLLCLTYPLLLNQRVTLTLDTDQPFLDLRTINPRIRSISRVLLGDATVTPPTGTSATGEFTEINLVSLPKLIAFNPTWMKDKGPVENYWMWGRHWFGLYRRPIAPTTVTIIFSATPAVLDVNTPSSLPDVAPVYHAVVADVATGLLIGKEGSPQSQRGLQRIQMALGQDQKRTA